MAKQRIANLFVDLVARTAAFKAGIQSAEGTLKKFKGTASGMAKAMAATAPFALAAAVGVGRLVASSMESIDALAKQSRAIGATTDQLQVMRRWAELAGMGNEQFDLTIRKMTENIGKANAGSAEQSRAFRAMGLDAQALADMRPEQVLGLIGDRLSEMPNAAARAQAAVRIFGEQGVKLAGAMNNASGALADVRAEMEATNQLVSDLDAQSIEAANDAMTRMRGAIGAAGNALTAELADPLRATAEIIGEMALEFAGNEQAIRFLGETGEVVLGWMANAVQSIGLATTGLNIAWETLGATWNAIMWNEQEFEDGLKRIVVLSEQFAKDSEISGATRVKLRMQELDAERKLAAFRKELAGEDGDDDDDGAAARQAAFAGLIRLTENMRTSLEKLVIEENKWKAAIQDSLSAGIITTEEAETRWTGVVQRFSDQRTAIIQAEQQARTKAAMEGLDAQLAIMEREDEAKRMAREAERSQILEHGSIINAAWLNGLDQRETWNKNHWTRNTANTLDAMVTLTSEMAKHSKIMFRINQGLAIAQATVNTAQGITKALAEYPPPLSFAMAGLVAGAGAAQIATIASTSFSGFSGGGGSFGLGGVGSTGENPGAGVNNDQTPAQLIITGGRNVDVEQLQELFDEMRERNIRVAGVKWEGQN